MKNKLLFLVVILFFGMSVRAQQNITFRSQLPYPTIPFADKLANIGGYVDSLGNEYALVGNQYGLSIVDVTNPDSIFEVTSVPGPTSLWREVKTWQGYAYVTTEGGNKGLQIVDLRNLPQVPVPYKYWKPAIMGDSLETIHALHVDNGYAYLYGHNISNQGAVFANLADPWNPTYAGIYNQNYIHDGYVRGDTLYGGHINNGWFSVMDVSNKSTPVVLQTQNTPNNFTHNTWLSDDGKTLFTTDETNNSYLAAYDITNLSNIELLDKIQMSPGSNSVVHNTHILNDYAVTSWYKEGVVIVDGSRPHNLVITGHYDTSPLSGSGMEGCWGVYPFLPSGNIVASDMQEGLFVLTPTYKRGCYLEGVVTDFGTAAPLFNVDITISTISEITYTNVLGGYATGVADSGTYNVTFSKAGYFPQTFSINLDNGVVDSLDVQLTSQTPFTLQGQVLDSVTLNPVAGAKVNFSNNYFQYNTTSDGTGNYSVPSFYEGTYDISYGKWTYHSECLSNQVLSSSTTPPVLKLAKGLSDDFSVDMGWTVTGNASTGMWQRGEPKGTLYGATPANPETDVLNDCLDRAFVTGNTGVTASDDDVDDGFTQLTSPVFDLTTYTDPYLNYNRWFFNDGGTGIPNDSLKIIIDNGITSANVEVVTVFSPQNFSWVAKSFKISNLIAITANMRIKIYTADVAPGHLVEGGFDYFLITEGSPIGVEETTKNEISMVAYPNPYSNELNVVVSNLSSAKKSKLILTDITGKKVDTRELPAASSNVQFKNEIAPGVYFLSLTNNNQIVKTIKIVKLK